MKKLQSLFEKLSQNFKYHKKNVNISQICLISLKIFLKLSHFSTNVQQLSFKKKKVENNSLLIFILDRLLRKYIDNFLLVKKKILK